MAITNGVKLSSDVTAAATSAGVGQAPDRCGYTILVIG